MATFKNISEGPRVLNGKEGPVTVQAGETAEVELSAAEAKIVGDTGWFEEAKSAKPAKKD